MSIQTRSSAITTRNERKSNISSSSKQKRGGKALVAAPAENLYPLSDTAKEHGGQTIRVSYGIKSHSVGWSGVMTSDLMTIEMAKVIPPGNKVAAVNGAVTTDMTLKPGETMEKEVNVEFAAIMENTGFFSQECGAQHGIWGLGYSSLSVDHKPTLLDTLSARMKIPNGFALQLCGRTANTTKSGNIFLGGYAQSHIVDPMQFVPLVKKDWYQVRLDGFKVKGEPVKGMVNLNLPKTIVDSGTTNILMSHYNLQFLIQSLASSGIVKWSSLIPEQDVQNFWFKNAVLRLPRSSFEIVTQARAVEVVLSGIDIPIYTSSFLRIKTVPPGQAPAGYVDFWWHGFASSTSPDAVEAEHESGGAVMPGSVGTILGETLFAGKVVYFERGNDDAEPGDADFGRIGFARGQNCFGPSTHSSVDVLAAQGELAKIDVAGLGPVRVAATSDANARLGPVGSSSSSSSSSGPGSATTGQFPNVSIASIPTANNNTGGQHTIHFKGFDGPIRLMGGGGMSLSPLMSGETNTGFLRTLAASLIVAVVAGML
ncbi:Beta-site APP-cleaving enzyme [Gryganskiella cystojenkinii]|nr:Beta-site APP-cleaving enzyme [Gryganskiella cystojenkinii]